MNAQEETTEVNGWKRPEYEHTSQRSRHGDDLLVPTPSHPTPAILTACTGGATGPTRSFPKVTGPVGVAPQGLSFMRCLLRAKARESRARLQRPQRRLQQSLPAVTGGQDPCGSSPVSPSTKWG